MSKRYGYARVSTQDQSLDLQIDALQHARCDTIYTDHGISGVQEKRPGLSKLLNKLQPGDTLVVWKLDRLGRSLQYLISLVDDLKQSGIHFASLSESIDTSTSGGKLLFHLMAALAEFERSLISERTRAGMAAARANGKHVGKRYALNATQQAAALQAIDNNTPISDVAKTYGVHPRTIRRLIERATQNSQMELGAGTAPN